MKRSIRFSLFLAGVCAMLPLTGLRAQAPAATATPAATPSVSAPAAPATTEPVKGGHGEGKGKMKAALEALTPDERHELRVARDKAMADPAVQAAKTDSAGDKKAIRKAMHEAMLRADPNVEPILEKMRGGDKLSKKDLK